MRRRCCNCAIDGTFGAGSETLTRLQTRIDEIGGGRFCAGGEAGGRTRRNRNGLNGLGGFKMRRFAVQAARRGDIRRHKRAMTSLFWLALVLTGAFTFLPGRVMHQLASNMLG